MILKLVKAFSFFLFLVSSNFSFADDSTQVHLASHAFGYGSAVGFRYSGELGIAKGLSENWQLAVTGYTPGSRREFVVEDALEGQDRIQLGLHYNFSEDFAKGGHLGGGVGFVNRAGALYAKAGYRFSISDTYRISYAPSITFVSSQGKGLGTIEILAFSVTF